jgi:hypothetical protein
MRWLPSPLFGLIALAAAHASPPASPHYEVEVSREGAMAPVFTHFSKAQKTDTNLAADVSWASVPFAAPLTVRVTNHRNDFTRARILPSSRAVEVRIQDGSVEFQIDRPGQIAVEFDENPTHPLFIFVDPPERDVPSPHDPGIIYFAPGEHHLGERFIEPKAGQTVYLAPGAVVHGRIKLVHAPGVTIRGRGILRGGHLPANPPDTYTVPHAIEADRDSPETTVEGITIVESPHYKILLRGDDCTVRNVKMIGWWFGTDGVGTGRRALVEDCFFRCNDDSLKLYNSGMVVRRCVIWQMENGAPFQISWNMNHDNAGFHVSNIDIIRVDHHQNANNRAVFNSIHGGSAHLGDYLFEDIRIENANFRFMLLQIRKTNWSKAKEWGRISNLTLRNVSADGPFHQRSAIRSDDPAGRIEDVVFENLRIGGRLVLQPEDADIDIDPATTSGILFRATPKASAPR